MRDRTTDIAAGPRTFPKTHWTEIFHLKDPSSLSWKPSLERLAEIYWRPVYAYLRRKWQKSNEEAKDLTQEFFLCLSDRNFFRNVTPEKGRFRAYVMAALDNFVRNAHRKRSRLKRGGGVRIIPLKVGEGIDPPSEGTPEQAFQIDWAQSILKDALEEMEAEYRAEGKENAYRIFTLRDLESPPDADLSYEGLARQFGLTVTDVTVLLHRARKKLRELVLQRVRGTVESDAEAESEMADLFGRKGT